MQRFDQEPEIFFLPFAVQGENSPDPLADAPPGADAPFDPGSPAFEFLASGANGSGSGSGRSSQRRPRGVPETSVLARRVPDFLHYLINDGRLGPTGMLEVHSPPGDGPLQWVTLRSMPGPEEVRAILAETGSRTAILVCGAIRVVGSRLRLVMRIHDGADLESETPDELAADVALTDPVPGLVRLAEELAAMLGISKPRELPAQLTANSGAFYKYLEGLDGAAVLSSDGNESDDGATTPVGDAREALVQPLVEAIRLDPQFGLALRTATMTLAVAVQGDRMTPASCGRIVDRCLSFGPRDGEGCVALAEQLVGIGDDRRAQAWLEHATGLESPPARGFESLGVLLANRGRAGDARELWTRGLDEDGNPDFFAHLARLAFHEGRVAEGWDAALRGLRRTHERERRAAEWRSDDLGRGILLRYLSEHCAELEVPEEVTEALLDLCDVFAASEKRIELGLCLRQVGEPGAARAELVAGLDDEVDDDIRDRAVRGLLALDVPRFDERFDETVALLHDDHTRPETLQAALGWLEQIGTRQPSFWPAALHRARGLQRVEQEEEALDVLWRALQSRPGQPELLGEMAGVFMRRGNTKRALECVTEALERSPRDGDLHGLRVVCLIDLGRSRDARRAIDRAIEIVPESEVLRGLFERLSADAPDGRDERG